MTFNPSHHHNHQQLQHSAPPTNQHVINRIKAHKPLFVTTENTPQGPFLVLGLDKDYITAGSGIEKKNDNGNLLLEVPQKKFADLSDVNMPNMCADSFLIYTSDKVAKTVPIVELIKTLKQEFVKEVLLIVQKQVDAAAAAAGAAQNASAAAAAAAGAAQTAAAAASAASATAASNTSTPMDQTDSSTRSAYKKEAYQQPDKDMTKMLQHMRDGDSIRKQGDKYKLCRKITIKEYGDVDFNNALLHHDEASAIEIIGKSNEPKSATPRMRHVKEMQRHLLGNKKLSYYPPEPELVEWLGEVIFVKQCITFKLIEDPESKEKKIVHSAY